MTDNNFSAAAKLLGITRPTLYDLLKKFDMPLAGALNDPEAKSN
jgi:two-component system NtrC family response regulator